MSFQSNESTSLYVPKSTCETNTVAECRSVLNGYKDQHAQWSDLICTRTLAVDMYQALGVC